MEDKISDFAGIAGTILTGFLGYFWLRLREDTTKRLELTRIYAAKQIEEFYAPLVALTDQLNITVNACEGLEAIDLQDKQKLEDLVYERNFEPAHEEIFQILKTKIHLVDRRIIPESFEQYLLHYRNQKIKTTLDRAGIKSKIVDVPFPSQFYWDVRDGLKHVAARYEDTIIELRDGVWPFLSLIKQAWRRQAARSILNTQAHDPPAR